MDNKDVRIVNLPRLHIASAYGFGRSPEEIAWEKLISWATNNRLIGHEGIRYFGFNNPSPSPGSPNYGYEQWMTVDEGVSATDEITIKDFEGGLYAVSRCKLPRIGETWQALVKWCENSPYRQAHHQWLEESLSPYPTPFDDVIMDIYLPISE
jgi:DNA gyrase inhibitor GyrI